ncbi:xylulokinase [Clostridium saccharobutylicum]|uniref:Carbohydrate kinase, FGGY n=1 Tax=Clostridium saccharobutylicum DSM 13864 TaxID=1345695 RepID=U5MLT9_CLOSA|nr:FGGY-family carbohydrate kinase [Clostridium saccharobutylicum]AGX41774.1 carbohydrate kinase, FGGY [Clostridium saccharobutylicum DSM 13864]AQR89053.1 L-fuculokinase [Clostridium saccharobutylicum]AQR98954.1 L-fuculokinase [Clostridium saccharobutylicum]AQS08674.1 L-fuculokinase [Clostridium saccharobutylicum]AQS12942.1 L-fuculokinase [Clostridium saccharobutylicum]
MIIKEKIVEEIQNGETSLGIEFGSTRIKAVLVGNDFSPLASGSFDWETSLEDGIWTYSLEEIWSGLQYCYQKLLADVKERYGITLSKIGSIGFSAMMHGYMAFDKQGNLLVPFRTWRNTMTEEAAKKLTELFQFNIPERWSIAHLYQAILKDEPHIEKLDFITTLAGYIHWQLTGEKVLGIGDASGMFPIDMKTHNYDVKMIDAFNNLPEVEKHSLNINKLLPKVLLAGENAGILTEEGAKKLDVSGNLQGGIPLCPPEGDAGTGMVATNSVAPRTGNISAGTSVFAMVVLEKPLNKVHTEIDMVTTPCGDLVGMAHANNGYSDVEAWVNIFQQFTEAINVNIPRNLLYMALYSQALLGDPDCGGVLAYNYFAGENITGVSEGRPLVVRKPKSNFNLPNLMRAHLFTSLGALKIGMDILLKDEGVKLDKLLGHGGLFKTPIVGQEAVAAAVNTPVSVMKTAGEGGAWGIALLASYLKNREASSTLAEFLSKKVFAGYVAEEVKPEQKDVDGFEQFMNRYKKGILIEQAAVDNLI